MTTPESQWDFFLAHAGPDLPRAEELYDRLADRARVFLDSRCLLLGDDWDTSLAAAQRASRITVVLVSSRTDEAYYEREEIAAALAMARKAREKHRVVPVFLDGQIGDDVPYGLRLKHGLTISEGLSLADAATSLLELLERLHRAGEAKARDAESGTTDGTIDGTGILLEPEVDWISPVRTNTVRYKLAVFDYDGTLLRGESFDFSWEAVWQALGFSKKIQADLRREYRQQTSADSSRANRVQAYRRWCDRACEHFKSRGLTRAQLKEICRPLVLTRNCREALTVLRQSGVVTAIVSGGLDTFLEDTFPDFRDHFDFVFLNQLLFSPEGLLTGVCATEYDFQGKAEALDRISERIGCTADEAVFVGDHFNDEAVMLRADKAIAYPPKDTVVAGVVHRSVTEDDLLTIVPLVLQE